MRSAGANVLEDEDPLELDTLAGLIPDQLADVSSASCRRPLRAPS